METIACPDCGHPNRVGATSCEACNYPIAPELEAPALERSRAEAGRAVRGPAPVSFSPFAPSRKPARRPRATQAVPLWLMFGFISAVAIVFVAVKANVERVSQPVEGSNANQQVRADDFLAALAKDSTDVDARIGLGNIYYDTANWTEAMEQYSRALALDSSRVNAIVDLGVCYYNLGNSDDAERLFTLALQRDPHQPIALFNLGIVNEARGQFDASLKFFHRAIESGPPQSMNEPLMAAIQRVAQKTGRTAPPLPDGR